MTPAPMHPEPPAGVRDDGPAQDSPRGRRRLWQLPADLRAALLGLGLPAERLRRCAERALGRLHRRPVELLGSDADVLSSVLCDLGTRNALSEAVQAELVARHAAATARMAAAREAAALQAAWQAALADGDVPGTAWALLTHPLGAALDEALRVDLRGWTFAQARAAQARQVADAGLRERLLNARAEADTLRLRLQHEQAAWERERAALARELAALRGQRLARPADDTTREAGVRSADAAPTHAPTHAPTAPPKAPHSAGQARPTAVQPVRAGPDPAPPAAGTAAPAAPGPATSPRPPSLALRGRRVLCVGGMPGAQDRYRRLVETAGAQFDFHDGGLEQGLHRLDRQLGAADLVVCQAGCLNHEAYRRVKGHCRRADKTCLFVERPSLAQFARTLGLASREPA